MKDNIKKAVESAEQEIQEKEIANLKSIIKDLLEKKVSKEGEKREIEKEISIIKQTIDDFKAGRLDKIKELQEKNEVAEKLLPFKIIIINQPIITQPWYWTYTIQPQQAYNYSASSGANNAICSAATVIGSTSATFCGGTYALNSGTTVNL